MSILNINTINTTKSTLLRQQGSHQLGTNQEHQPQNVTTYQSKNIAQYIAKPPTPDHQ